MGDPRIEKTKASVLVAAGELLQESGFRGLTIESISERSGVAKTTIYRHWKNAFEIIIETVGECEYTPVDPDLGSVKADLMVLASGSASNMHDPRRAAVAISLIEGAAYDDNIRELQIELVKKMKSPIYDAIHRGIDRGELKPDTNVEILASQINGAFFYQRFVLHSPVKQEYTGVIVEGALSPWLASK